MRKKDCQNLILFVSALSFAVAFATSAAGIAVVRGHNVEPWGGYDDAENEDELVWCMQRKQNREGDPQSDQGWSLFITSFFFFWLSFFLLISRVCLVQLAGFADGGTRKTALAKHARAHGDSQQRRAAHPARPGNHPGIMQKPGIPAQQMQCTGTRERA